MASITSLGVGSTLDMNGIVDKLVSIKKAPIAELIASEAKVTAKVSALGQIKSKFADLKDQMDKLTQASAWGARTATSSNTSVATISAKETASVTDFSLVVSQLAKTQSAASEKMTTGQAVGEGTLKLRLGTWDAVPAFAPSTSADVDISVSADDTVTSIADKINAANAGVSATVFNDGTSERLLLRSANTGAVSGFRLQAFDTLGGALTGGADLSRLAFDPESGAFGMAGAGAGVVQYAQDAKASIDGYDVTSGSNTLEGNFPGVTINLLATTSGTPLTMAITKDTTPAVRSLTDFVTSYNALTDTLNELSKYDPATNISGEFQGDSMIYTIENSLRALMGSTSMGASMQRLSDIGIELNVEGKLTLNVAKITVSANNGNALQQLFANDNGNAQTNGFAIKLRDLATSLMDTGGSLTLTGLSLQRVLTDNSAEQTKVSDEVTEFEARLRTQYAAVDAQISRSNSVSMFLAAQIAAYNNQK